MPIAVVLSDSDYSSGLVALNAFLMPRKILNESSNNDKQSIPAIESSSDRASILIFISAQALGSLGFAVSLFAIWFGWLLPAALTPSSVAEGSDIKNQPSNLKARLPSKQPRRSTPIISAGSPLPIPIRRASAPVTLTPILVPRYVDTYNHSKHVYFTDTSPPPFIRRNTMPESEPLRVGEQLGEQSDSVKIKEQQVESDASPIPSRSVSPTPMISEPQPTVEGGDEGVLDSDASPHSSKVSLHMNSCFQKFKRFKHNRPEPASGKQADQLSIASTDTTASAPVKGTKRSNVGLVASWTLTRNRTAPDVTVSDSGSPSPSRLVFGRHKSPARPITSPAATMTAPPEIISPTFLSRKSRKRMSAPIPRTSPYEAPYFASPPLLLSSDNASHKTSTNYRAYLKGLPQFEDEVQHNSPAPASDEEDMNRSRGRPSSIKRVDLKGIPFMAVPKRRSASEDWTQRPEPAR